MENGFRISYSKTVFREGQYQRTDLVVAELVYRDEDRDDLRCRVVNDGVVVGLDCSVQAALQRFPLASKEGLTW